MTTIAIIEKGTGNRYSVYLPDSGGVHGTGATRDAINESMDYRDRYQGVDAGHGDGIPV
jgi:hypothetical protein